MNGGIVMGDTAVGRGPAGVGIVEGDVAWDRRYLQLEPPAGVHTFAEFGQAAEDALLSPVAVTEPFPILSDEGVAGGPATSPGPRKPPHPSPPPPPPRPPPHPSP